MTDTPHQRFTVSSTSYLRNLSREDLRSETLAVHYQDPPRKTETGTSISLRFPMLILAFYLKEQHAIADKVAAILEKHWDDDTDELAALRKEIEDLRAQGERQSSTIAIHHQNFDQIYERACRDTGEFAEWVRSITHPEADQR
ncbi:hypothetical protein [Sphingopyxis sp. 113P3]|uniref:hypothetical protein n=1 Tax=Sphingopyxis sp. (strain 113P3) TaxID=292913 RepID=UPI0006AD32F1|nr:hypothetical protein [Sphingopyxis sp. 113P3]ALC13800.1 hypothetical protein LH20_17725 [Sphingopyxis sp. 113P3]